MIKYSFLFFLLVSNLFGQKIEVRQGFLGQEYFELEGKRIGLFQIRELVHTNETFSFHLKKATAYHWAGMGSSLLGILPLAADTFYERSGTQTPLVFHVAGLGGIVAAMIFESKSQSHMKKGVEIYNNSFFGEKNREKPHLRFVSTNNGIGIAMGL